MELTDKLTAIAEAIRTMTNGTQLMSLEEMAEEILAIQTTGLVGTVGELTYNWDADTLTLTITEVAEEEETDGTE